jgi:hypothetical protein
MKTTLYLSITALIIIIGTMTALSQTTDFIYRNDGSKVILDKIGPVKIITKEDGTSKNCIINKINPSYIVYEKDGSLHDLAIDKILRIQISKEEAIYFDADMKPKIMKTLVE